MRYMAKLIDIYGNPTLGTFDMVSGDYQSPSNAVRFLAKKLAGNDHCKAGQYGVFTWPRGDYRPDAQKRVGTLYKRA